MKIRFSHILEIGLGIALILFAVSCRKDEVNYPIEFDASAMLSSDATKSTSTIEGGTIFDNGDMFGVFSTYHLGQLHIEFMRNQDVTHTNGIWSYSPMKYWPNNPASHLSFYAYYPFVEKESIGGDYETPIVHYDIDGTIDIMYSQLLNEKKEEGKPLVQPHFSFDHLLKRLRFKFVAGNGFGYSKVVRVSVKDCRYLANLDVLTGALSFSPTDKKDFSLNNSSGWDVTNSGTEPNCFIFSNASSDEDTINIEVEMNNGVVYSGAVNLSPKANSTRKNESYLVTLTFSGVGLSWSVSAEDWIEYMTDGTI